jgi:predicted RNA binding protein YcfA (HicA-like mRNA interferase family)
MVFSFAERFAVKMRHETKNGTIIFPNHGSQEMGKGLENKILKDAAIKK